MISFVVRLNDPSPLMSHTSTEGENVRVEEEGLNDREFPSFDRSVYWRHGQRWPRCHFKYQSASLGITCWLHFLPQGNYRHRASHRNSPRKNFFNDRRPRNRFSNLKTPFSLRSPTILLPSSFILERGKLGANHGIQLTSRCDFLIAEEKFKDRPSRVFCTELRENPGDGKGIPRSGMKIASTTRWLILT